MSVGVAVAVAVGDSVTFWVSVGVAVAIAVGDGVTFWVRVGVILPDVPEIESFLLYTSMLLVISITETVTSLPGNAREELLIPVGSFVTLYPVTDLVIKRVIPGFHTILAGLGVAVPLLLPEEIWIVKKGPLPETESGMESPPLWRRIMAG